MNTSDDEIVYNTRLVEVNSYFRKPGESNNDFSFENSSDVLAKVRKASLKSLSIRNEFEDITNRNNELYYETQVEKTTLTSAGLNIYRGFERILSFGGYTATSYWRIIGHPSYGFVLVIMLESTDPLINITLEDTGGNPLALFQQTSLDDEVMLCVGPVTDPSTEFGGLVTLNVGPATTDVDTTNLYVENIEAIDVDSYGVLDFIPHFHNDELIEWIGMYVSPFSLPSRIEVDGHFFKKATNIFNDRAMYGRFQPIFNLDNVIVVSRADVSVLVNRNFDAPKCLDHMLIAGIFEHSIKIPTGNYDVSQLAQAVVDAFAVVGITMSWTGGVGQPLTLTTNPKINLYNTSPSTLSYNPMAYVLGITEESLFQSPVTLGVPPHLVPLDAIYIRSKELCFQSSTSLIQGGNINYPVFSIVRLNGSGNWVNWFDVFNGEFSTVFQRPTNLQTMSFQITDQLGNMIDFIGDINIILEITHEV